MVKYFASKREKKTTTVEQYKAAHMKNKDKVAEPKFFTDISDRYHFKRPTQRLNELDFHIGNKIQEIKLLPYSYDNDNIGSFFFDELQLTKSSEFSAEFTQLYNEIIDVSQSLSLILLNLPRIVNVLIEGLKLKSLRIQVLGLLPALFRDCQEEIFNIYMDLILNQLVQLLTIEEIDVLEKVFTVLAYSLKYLFRKIIENFDVFFEFYFCSLFSHSNKHIRRFSSESFAYLFKKMKNEYVKPSIEKVSLKLKVHLQETSEQECATRLRSLADMFADASQGFGKTLSPKSAVILKGFWANLTNDSDKHFRSLFYFFMESVIRNTVTNRSARMELEPTQIAGAAAEQKLVAERKINFLLGEFFKIFAEQVQKDAASIDIEMWETVLNVFLYLFTEFNGKKADAEICALFFSHLMGPIMEDPMISSKPTIRRYLVISIAKLLKYNEKNLTNLYVKLNEFLINDEAPLSPLESNLFLFSLVSKKFYENRYQKDKDDFLNEDEILKINHLFSDQVYKYTLYLVLNKIEFNDFLVPFSESPDAFYRVLNLYIFLQIHKYTRESQKERILLKKIDASETTLLKNFLNEWQLEASPSNRIENYFKMLIILKLLKVVQIPDLDKELNQIVWRLYKVFEAPEHHKDPKFFTIDPENIYDLSFKTIERIYLPIIVENQEEFKNDLCTQGSLVTLIKGEMLQLMFEGSSCEIFTEFLFNNSREVAAYASDPFYLSALAKLCKENFFPELKKKKIQDFTLHQELFISGDEGIQLRQEGKLKPLYETLVNNLLCKYKFIRKDSLLILNRFGSVEVRKLDSAELQPYQGISPAIQLLAQIEALDVNLQTERQILMYITQIKGFIVAKQLPDEHLLPVINFCFGLAYARLSTLWTVLQDLLRCCLENYTEQSFQFLIRHMIYLNFRTSILNSQGKNTNALDFGEEFEQTNSDTQAERLIKIFFEDYRLDTDCVEDSIVLNTFVLALKSASNVCEKKKTYLLKVIKSFLETEYFVVEAERNTITTFDPYKYEEYMNNEELVAKLSENVRNGAKEDEKLDSWLEANKTVNKKLESFLQLILSMRSLKEEELASYYQGVFMKFLRKTNEALQVMALDCLMLLKDDLILKYEKVLKNLQKKETARGEMLNLKLEKETGNIPKSDRKVILPVIISVLYPKLFCRKGNKNKRSMELNQGIVFNFFSSLDESELSYLLNLLEEIFSFPAELSPTNLSPTNDLYQPLLLHLTCFPLSKWIGFLNTLKNIIIKLGSSLLPFVPRIAAITLLFMRAGNLIRSSESDKSFERFKQVNKLAIKRLYELYENFPDSPSIEAITEAFTNINEGKITKLAQEAVQEVSGVLKLFETWSQNDIYKGLFLMRRELIIPSIIEIFTAKNVDQKVIDCINGILLNLLETQDENEGSLPQECKKLIGENVPLLIRNMTIFFQNKSTSQGGKKNQTWKPNNSSVQLLLGISSFFSASAHEINKNDLLTLLSLFAPLIEWSYLVKSMRVKTFERSNSEYLGKMDFKHQSIRERSASLAQSVLSIFSALLFLAPEASENYFNQCTNLLVYLPSERLRLALISCFEAMKGRCLSDSCFETMKQMNVYERTAEQRLDYEIILPICYKFNTEQINTLDFHNLHIILLNYLYLIDNEELSLRLAALSGYQEYFKKVSEEWMAYDLDEKDTIMKFIKSKFLPHLIKIMKRNGGSRDDYKLKQVYLLLDLYLNYARKFIQPDQYAEHYLDLHLLQNKTDANQDFFINVFEIQVGKRLKAINALGRRLREDNQSVAPKFSSLSLTKFIIPLLHNIIFVKSSEGNKSGGSKMPKTATTISNYKSLLESSVEVYSLCTRYLTWGQYQKLLKKLVNILEKNNQNEKIVVKLLCAILNNLDRFNLPDIVELVDSEMKDATKVKNENSIMNKLLERGKKAEERKQEPEEKPEESHNNVNEEIDEEALLIKGATNLEKSMAKMEEVEAWEEENSQHGKIVRFLRSHVLIPLKNHMFEKKKTNEKEKKLRVFLTIAIIKLSKRLPFSLFAIEFPKVIGNICISLKSREAEVRENARKALTDIIKIMGPYFLHFIIREMNFILKLGYQRHVLNYTLFTLLNALINAKASLEHPDIINGSLDYCIPIIIPHLIDELLGRIKEEKEVEEIKNKTPEFKKTKAYDCFNMLASIINFETSMIMLLSFLNKELEQASISKKNINRCEEILKNILDGLSKNTSVKADSMIIIAYSLVSESLKNLKPTDELTAHVESTKSEYKMNKKDLAIHNKNKTYGIQQGAAEGKNIYRLISQSSQKNKFEAGRVMGSFSLKLLLSNIKRRIIFYDPKSTDPNKNDIIQKLEPLTKLVIDSLDSNNNSIISSALRLLAQIIDWPLKIVKKNFKKITGHLLKILEGLGSSDMEMVQECFKLLRGIFETGEARRFLTDGQLKGVIKFIELYMDSNDSITEPLECLKVMVHKKVVLPEIYDLMKKVSELMITSFAKHVQNVTKTVYLKFLMEYPTLARDGMEGTLISQNIYFLIKHFEFKEANGRLVVFELCEKLVNLMPFQIIDEFSELLFNSSIIQRTREDVGEICTQIDCFIRALVDKVSAIKAQKLSNLILSWMKSTKLKVLKAGLTGLPFFFESKTDLSKDADIFISRIDQVLINMVQETKEFLDERKEKRAREKKLSKSEWRQFLNKEEDTKTKSLTHLEVCKDSLSVLVQLFSLDAKGNELQRVASALIARSKDFRRNLIYLVGLHPSEEILKEALRLIHRLYKKESHKYFEGSEGSDEGVLMQLVSIFKIDINHQETEESLFDLIREIMSDFVGFPSGQNIILSCLEKLRLMTRKLMARISNNLKKIKRVFHLIELYSSIKGSLFSDEIVEKLLVFVIRIKAAEKNFETSNIDISGLGEEILNKIKANVDMNIFFKIYSKVQSETEHEKGERKRKEKELLITDPEEVARKKILRNQKNKKTRRNKILRLKGFQPVKKLKSE